MCTLSEMRVLLLIECLNPSARRYRIYWFTPLGVECRKGVCRTPLAREGWKEVLDWDLFGKVCSGHRRAVIKAVQWLSRPCEVKRHIKLHDPGVRISVNNIHDVLRELEGLGVVRRLKIEGKSMYELSETGARIQRFLKDPESGF